MITCYVKQVIDLKKVDCIISYERSFFQACIGLKQY